MRAVAIVAASIVVAAAACGSEGETRNPRASAFRSTANAICERTFDVARLQREARRGLAREAARWERGVDRLAALDVPAADARRFRTMLAHLRRMVKGVRRGDRAADESVLPYLIGALVEGRRASRVARSLHLNRCVVVGPVPKPPRDPEKLGEAARALVPDGARVARILGCDQESCLLALDLRGAGDASSAAEDALKREDWIGIRSGGDHGSRWVMADRNDLQAMFQFPARDRPPCDTRADAPFCADTLWVRRVTVPPLP